MVWLAMLALHVATILSIEYVVFSPNVPLSRFATRHACRLRSANLRRRDRVQPLAHRVAARATGYAVDATYIVRFWTLYALHDIAFFLLVFLLFATYLMRSLGTKETCEYFYQLNPAVEHWASRFRDAALDSCFDDLARYASEDLRLPPANDDRCEVRDGDEATITPGRFRVSLVSVAVATYALLGFQWLLLHWLPCAMAFARPKRLRDRLKRLKSTSSRPFRSIDLDSLCSSDDEDDSPRSERDKKKKKKKTTVEEESSSRHSMMSSDQVDEHIEHSFRHHSSSSSSKEEKDPSPLATPRGGGEVPSVFVDGCTTTFR